MQFDYLLLRLSLLTLLPSVQRIVVALANATGYKNSYRPGQVISAMRFGGSLTLPNAYWSMKSLSCLPSEKLVRLSMWLPVMPPDPAFSSTDPPPNWLSKPVLMI